MAEKERHFFTIDEALDAVRIAFEQYQGQVNLLTVVWPLVFGEDAYLIPDARRRRIWAKMSDWAKTMPFDEAGIKQRIVAQLMQAPPDPDRLASICTHVFGAHVEAGQGPKADSAPGIWIDTDMADFVCIQCGHCCRTLNYHDGCTMADYRRWQSAGRSDILEWVGTVRQGEEIVACRIWMHPGTNRYAETCPWLKAVDASGRTECTIHDARPMVCRHYPGSRKHARLTGCRGI